MTLRRRWLKDFRVIYGRTSRIVPIIWGIIYFAAWFFLSQSRSTFSKILAFAFLCLGIHAFYIATFGRKKFDKHVATRDYEQLKELGLGQEMNEIIDRFLKEDHIDFHKFYANFQYYIGEATVPATPSCWKRLDLPGGYPSWFAAAYPDIVNFFTSKSVELDTEEEIMRFLREGYITEEELHPNSDETHMSTDTLHKLKEYYKRINPNKKFECGLD